MSNWMRLGLAVMLTGATLSFFPDIPRIHPYVANWLMLGGTILFALAPWRDDSRAGSR